MFPACRASYAAVLSSSGDVSVKSEIISRVRVMGVMVLNPTFNNAIYIMGVSFIGGGNRSTWEKTCRMSLTNFITYIYCIHPHELDSNSQLEWL